MPAAASFKHCSTPTASLQIRPKQTQIAHTVGVWSVQVRLPVVSAAFQLPDLVPDQATSSMSGLNSLPDEVLKLVLQHVSLKDRLGSCCLVNKRLHAAAVAATEQLTFGPSEASSFSRVTCARTFNFMGYLDHYGQHVTRLHMECIPAPLLQLPCPNLLELVLSDCDVLFGPTALGQPGVIQGCPKLTHLQFTGTVKDADDALSGSIELNSLSSLVHLQHLEVLPYVPCGRCTLSAATLPRLKHLTCLKAHKLSAESLGQLGPLTKLQELVLSANISPVGPSTVPGLTFPASITKLAFVMRTPVEAAILSLLPAELKHLAVWCHVEGPAEGPGSFLSGMARLQHLTHLDLGSPRPISLPPPGPAYSALTASSALIEFKMYAGLLPEGVWPFMFHVPNKLPHLTSLNMYDDNFGGDTVLASAWRAADVCSVVGCCPNLRKLPQTCMQHGQHVSDLRYLTGVTSLMLGYGAGDFDAVESSLQGIAAVTQLQDLIMYLHTRELSVASLLPLTSLTALEDLQIFRPDGAESESDDDDSEDTMVLDVCLHQVNQLTSLSLAEQAHAMGAASLA